MKKFEVGKTYCRTGLFGPSFLIKCIKNDGINATFVQVGYESEDSSTIEIEVYDGGERCIVWEYMGHTGYVYAE